jgi:mono/diheme cytochrome c family protein
MRSLVALGIGALTALAGLAACLFVPRDGEPAEIAASGDPARGAYVLRLGGCVTCHTDAKNGGAFLAGGRALGSPYGTFYVSNITPDPATGIGGWSTADFVRTMTEGISPDGHPYFPAFPYTSYTRMQRDDLGDLKAYLDTVEPVPNQVRDHDLRFPFGFRPLLRGWQLLFFDPGTFQPDPQRSEIWNRGAYIVNGPGHCSECHTPRNLLGGPERDRFLAGTRDGPDGKPVPNITPDAEDGIGNWSKSDLTFALKTSILPDGDVLGGAMAEVVKEATSHWTDQDREAVAEYLFTVEPLKGAAKPAQEGPAKQG